MRRLTGLLLAALVATTLLAAPAAAEPAAGAPDAALVLAVEGEPTGPNPMPRDAEGNPARELGGYENLETPFTWGAAWILMFLGLLGLTVMGAVYYLRIHKPSQGATGRR